MLLVDDAGDALELYSEVLSRQGLNVAIASSGAQALAKALTLVPQAIILDVSLPDLDGIEVCRRLKAAEQTRLTTAHPRESDGGPRLTDAARRRP